MQQSRSASLSSATSSMATVCCALLSPFAPVLCVVSSECTADQNCARASSSAGVCV